MHPCPECNSSVRKNRIGAPRLYCSRRCGVRFAQRRRLDSLPICAVDGCLRKATRTGFGLCETHYYRLRRTGSTVKAPWAFRHMCITGYVKVKVVGHPMMTGSGWQYEHRVIAYDANAGLCPPCFWCSSPLAWSETHIDHLDENKSNNKRENLAVTCVSCNRARGAMKAFIQRLNDGSFAAFVANANAFRAAARAAASEAVLA